MVLADTQNDDAECFQPGLIARRASAGIASRFPNRMTELQIDQDTVVRSRTMGETTYSIKNTFIESGAPPSPSLAGFYCAREVQSCPSERAGSLSNCFEDIASISTKTPVDTPCAQSCQAPCVPFTPTADDAVGALWQSIGPVCHEWSVPGPRVDYYYCMPDMCHSLAMQEEAWMNFASFPEPVHAQGQPLLSSEPSFVDAAPPGKMRNATVVCLADLIQDSSFDLSEDGCAKQDACPEQVLVSTCEFVVPVSDFQMVDDQIRSNVIREVGRSAVLTGSPPAPPPGPAPGSAALPSIGSASHGTTGDCKPCAFFHTKGCEKGPACVFCHACGPEERRRRKRDKLDLQPDFSPANSWSHQGIAPL